MAWRAARRLSGRPRLHLLALGLVTNDLRTVRHLVRRELPPFGGRTIDFGCGPGLLADLLARGDYLGVDPDRRNVEWARRYRPGVFLAGPLHRLDLPEARFDQALLFGALERLSAPAARTLVAELRRVLCAGGRVLVIEEASAWTRARPGGMSLEGARALSCGLVSFIAGRLRLALPDAPRAG
jgi:SAM-dependent methyltransferase